MFVNENIVFKQTLSKVKFCTIEGDSILVEVNVDASVESVKIEAVSQLFDSADSSKLSSYYNVLHSRLGKVLNETDSLRQADVKDSDELVLLRRRMPLSTVFSQKKENKANQSPSVDDIAAATSSLPAVNTDRQVRELALDVDFQTELKKILVALIDVAQRLLCVNPASFAEARKYTRCSCSQSTVTTSKQNSVDPAILQQIVDMGFSRTMATKALLVNRMSQVQAIQWLCDNPSVECNVSDKDADDHTPVAAESVAATSDSGGQAASVADDASESAESNELLQQELFELSQMSGISKVRRMLDAFKAYKRRVFKPDTLALQSLLEMGFDESDAVEALQKHNNARNDACDWLLTRDTTNGTSAAGNGIQGLDQSLDQDSSIYKAIMSNHVIQLALVNPKTLTALLHMLESPSTVQQWLHDTDLGPMLLQISRLYYAEKYHL